MIGRPFGIPRTGVFGLLDLVGIDLDAAIDGQHGAALPPDDAFHTMNKPLCPWSSWHDQGRLYRPQGQGRFLSAQPRKGAS